MKRKCTPNRATAQACLLGLVVMPLTGCMPKLTIAEVNAMTPPKPVQLDLLHDWAGTWETTGVANMSMFDAPIILSGRSVRRWDGNGRYLVADLVTRMEGFDEEVKAIETVTYDPHSKLFRCTATDSNGGTLSGVMRYNDKTGIWRLRATRNSPFGKKSVTGWVKHTDTDTAEWGYSEYMLGGLRKITEFTGTSKRVK